MVEKPPMAAFLIVFFRCGSKPPPYGKFPLCISHSALHFPHLNNSSSLFDSICDIMDLRKIRFFQKSMNFFQQNASIWIEHRLFGKETVMKRILTKLAGLSMVSHLAYTGIFILLMSLATLLEKPSNNEGFLLHRLCHWAQRSFLARHNGRIVFIFYS